MGGVQKVPTNSENRDARVEAVADLVGICDEIAQALSCAESCETDSDLDANIDDAIEAAERFLKLAREARS